MSVDISAAVTRVWPQTEGKLGDSGELDYAAEKAKAVARAKREAYGRHDVPSDESDIPDIVAYWVADRSVVLLIPLAIEYYTIEEHISTAQEGATLTHYNKVEALQKLKGELEAECAKAWAEVVSLAQPAEGDDDRIQDQLAAVPGVSIGGLLVDPMQRAYDRGWF